jgi:putative transposase
LTLFEKRDDYVAFEKVLAESIDRENLPIFSYCIMPNHWHFVVQPTTDNQLSDFFRWLTHTHTMRWHAHYHTEGTGHLYQGRFKAFPIETNEYLLGVMRYVERNPLRAGLVDVAEDWEFSSAGRAALGKEKKQLILADWPIPRPREWRSYVNKPQTESEVKAIRQSVIRGAPYGSTDWVTQSAVRLQLAHTRRSRGRPKKKSQTQK